MSLTLKKVIVPLLILFLWLIAIAIAFMDLDSCNFGRELSWGLVNLSVLIGIVGNQFVWSKYGKNLLGLALLFVKLCVIIYLIKGWWTLQCPDGSQSSLYFFWVCPPFMVILNAFEVGIILKYFKKNN